MSKNYRDFSTGNLNQWVGRTLVPPDLLTLVDEHLRKTYKNVYAHPITPNEKEHWPTRELGYLMISAGGILGNRLNVGTVYMDRVEMNVTTGNITLSAAKPDFFQDLVKFIDDGAYIGGIVRRN